MGLHPPDVVTVEQPVELFTSYRHDILLRGPRPVELVPLETLVSDHKAVTLPYQQLQLVASGVDESEQRAAGDR